MPRHEPWTPERATEIIAQHQDQKGATLPILHALQDVFGCVPLDAEPMIELRAVELLSAEGDKNPDHLPSTAKSDASGGREDPG